MDGFEERDREDGLEENEMDEDKELFGADEEEEPETDDEDASDKDAGDEEVGNNGGDDEPEKESLSPEDLARESVEVVSEILAFFPRVKDPKISWRIDDGSVWVEVEGDPTGRLIGRKGQTIDALEHVLSKIMSHRMRKKVNVHVDAEKYKQRQREKLIRLAQQTADYVVETNQPRALEPMSPADRRTVHIALRSREDVITASEGQDRDRFVVIWPQEDDEE